MSVRIGLLGCGFIAGHHMECIKRCYGVSVNIVGVYDISPDAAGAFAEAHGLKVFPLLDDLLSCVDAVDICTPPFTHKDAILKAARAGVHILCEKPLIGYAPPADAVNFYGLNEPKEPMLKEIKTQLSAIYDVVTESGVTLAYFENFIYTPQVQKEAEIIKTSGAQILRMMGEESHRGNHAKYSSQWKLACGGSLLSTGSHPLGAILYLKRVEGLARDGNPIRPASVSARIHTLTGLSSYRDEGHLRSDYHDVEDYAWAHIVFEDGTVADIIAGATVLGGINDYVEVFANNHHTRCEINPATLMKTYNPKGSAFEDIYINYGISTKEGWLFPNPDENILFGYQGEMQDALLSIASGTKPSSDISVAVDTINVIYSAYFSAEQNGREIALERIGSL